MPAFEDSRHFGRTLGSLWWQSLKTAITSAELSAALDDSLRRQPSLQQNFLGSLWWQSLKTAITSTEPWAVFDDGLWKQPSFQQNFGQCLMTIFKDSHRFTGFNENAFLERTLCGRFREIERHSIQPITYLYMEACHQYHLFTACRNCIPPINSDSKLDSPTCQWFSLSTAWKVRGVCIWMLSNGVKRSIAQKCGQINVEAQHSAAKLKTPLEVHDIRIKPKIIGVTE